MNALILTAEEKELIRFRERDAKRKLAQKKHREILKTRKPKQTDETEEQLALKKATAVAKKKAYMNEYAKKRKDALKSSRENVKTFTEDMLSKYKTGELQKYDKDKLIEFLLMGVVGGDIIQPPIEPPIQPPIQPQMPQRNF